MKVSKIEELLRIVAESGVSEVEIEEEDFKLTIRQSTPQVVMQPSSPHAAYGMPPGMAAPYGGGYGGYGGGGYGASYAPPQGAPQPPQGQPQGQPQGGGQPAPPQGGQQQTAPASGAPAQSPSAPQAAGSASNDGAAAPAQPDTESQEKAGAEDNEHVVKAPIVGTFYEAPSPDSDPYVGVGDHVSEGDVLCIIEAMKLMNEIEAETSGTIKEVLVEDAEPVEFDQPLFLIEED